MEGSEKIFESIFENSKQNAIIIMDADGIIQKVNGAFTSAYGYATGDLQSKHFRILFIDKDQALLRPEIELNQTHRQGSSSDENYLVHKDGTPVWVTGESVLVKTGKENFIVKIIHNIHAQKQLERYLLASDELLDGLFNSVQAALLLLDSQMRTIKCNGAFLKLFRLESPVPEGMKLQQIGHTFWSDDELKNDIRNALVQNEKINKAYIHGNDKDNFTRLYIKSKALVGDRDRGRRLLLVIRDE